jgi:DNA-directed RNA polymerase
MRDIEENPDTIVKFPIFLDATCSGIKHLAALIKDTDLAKEVNLIPR